jgi:hypothetical protein
MSSVLHSLTSFILFPLILHLQLGSKSQLTSMTVVEDSSLALDRGSSSHHSRMSSVSERRTQDKRSYQ